MSCWCPNCLVRRQGQRALVHFLLVTMGIVSILQFCVPSTTTTENDFESRTRPYLVTPLHSLTSEGLHTYFISSYGFVCGSPCARVESRWLGSYYGCTVKRFSLGLVGSWTWDYCSPNHSPGTMAITTTTTKTTELDSSGRPCTSRCDFYGRRFKWCWITEDQKSHWSTCGTTQASFIRYHQINGDRCVDTCAPEPLNPWFSYWFSSYHKCHSEKTATLESCSIMNDVTIWGDSCREGHGCDRHGKDYYWCYTGVNRFSPDPWDYCSPITNSYGTPPVKDECPGGATSLDSNNDELLYYWEVSNSGSHAVAKFTQSQSGQVFPQRADIWGPASEAIFEWEEKEGWKRVEGSLPDHTFKTIYTAPNDYSMELDGLRNAPDGRHARIQMRSSGVSGSEIVASVDILILYLVAYGVKALVDSLMKRQAVTVSRTTHQKKCEMCSHIVQMAQQMESATNNFGLNKTQQSNGKVTETASHGHFERHTCTHLYNEHRTANYAQEVRRGIQTDNPITNYLFRQYDDEGTRRDIPLAVQARMTHGNARCPRTSFPGNAFWNRQMEFMGALLPPICDRNLGFCDEKGHMVGSQLCGPIQMYNMAPQSEGLNRNVERPIDNGWPNLENHIATFVRLDCGHVDWMVVVNYDFEVERRPKGFKVCANFHFNRDNRHIPIRMYYENI